MTVRFEAMNNLLDEFGADWVLINDSVSARYFSGFCSSNVFLLYSPNKKFLLTDFRYKTKAEDFCEKEGWKFVEIKSGEICKKIDEILKKPSILLIQDNFLTVENFEFYQKNMKNVSKFVFGGKEIDSIFFVKNQNEINSIKKAAKIADESVSEWLDQLKCGISEFEAARLLDLITIKNGSEKPSFDTIVLFGENTALPHGAAGKNRKLKNRDFILFDFGCTVNGFRSDMTRTVCFGKEKKELLEIYEIVLEAQKIGLDTVKSGIKAKDVDKKVRDFIERKTYGNYFGHGTGHSVGLRIHEKPALNKTDETILQNGMVVTIEPGIYIPNAVGVRIEDMVIVGENFSEIITKRTKNFTNI